MTKRQDSEFQRLEAEALKTMAKADQLRKSENVSNRFFRYKSEDGLSDGIFDLDAITSIDWRIVDQLAEDSEDVDLFDSEDPKDRRVYILYNHCEDFTTYGSDVGIPLWNAYIKYIGLEE